MVNVAVVGCGYWGPNLIRNFIVCPATDLIWCCDLDESRLNDVLAPYPGVRKTNTLDTILADKNIDAVAIATPVRTHFPIAKACLKGDKHVLIEKPLASTLREGEALVNLAQEKGLQLMCDHTFCYTGAVRKIKQLLDDGLLGIPLYFDSVRINLGLFQNDVNVMWDLAAHDLSILDFLIDKQPNRVSASGCCHSGNGLENIAYVSLNYSESFIAHFHVNWLSPVKMRKTILCCSDKMLVWDDLDHPEKIKVYDKGINVVEGERQKKDRVLVSYRSGDIHVPHIDNTEALFLAVNEFANSIISGCAPLTDGEAGLRVLRILDAAQRSIKTDGTNVSIT